MNPSSELARLCFDLEARSGEGVCPAPNLRIFFNIVSEMVGFMFRTWSASI